MQVDTKLELNTKKPKPLFKENLNYTLHEIKKNKMMYVLIAPFMILFTLFTVVPVISSIVLSFTYYNIIQPPKFVGWLNFKELFLNDDVFLIALKNTFILALITGPLSYFACLLFAWFVNELKPKVRAFATLLFYAPSISGNVFIIWTIIFSGDSYGILNGLLIKFGFLKAPIQWLSDSRYNMFVVIVVSLWLSLGTSFLAFIAGLQTVDKSLYEAGEIDGVKNRWQELYLITIPSMKPQLMFGAVMTIGGSLNVGAVCTALVGFPSPMYSVHTLVLHMQDYGTLRYEMGYASAIAVVLFAITLTVNAIVKKLLKTD